MLVALGNESSVRHGLSGLMDGLGRKGGLSKDDIYTVTRLDNEKACWSDLLDKCGDYIWGAVLYLEPTGRGNESFCKAIYAHLRAKGFKGPILNNTSRYTVAGAIQAPSINKYKDWFKSKAGVRNGDGMQDGTTAERVKKMAQAPGPQGFDLWFDALRGSSAGRGTLQDYMLTIK